MKKIVLSIALLLSGCAPSLGSGVNINKIPDAEARAISNFNNGTIKLHVGEFTDDRPDSSVVKIQDGDSVEPTGSVSNAVQQAFERRLKMSGVRVSPFDTATLSGSIREWKADLAVGFPSSQASARAAFSLDLRDAEGKTLYSGTYKGFSTLEHPFIEGKVEEVLGEAMGQAIDQALNDPNLVKLITR